MWTIQPKAQAQGGDNTRLSPVVEKASLAVTAATCACYHALNTKADSFAVFLFLRFDLVFSANLDVLRQQSDGVDRGLLGMSLLS